MQLKIVDEGGVLYADNRVRKRWGFALCKWDGRNIHCIIPLEQAAETFCVAMWSQKNDKECVMSTWIVNSVQFLQILIAVFWLHLR